MQLCFVMIWLSIISTHPGKHLFQCVQNSPAIPRKSDKICCLYKSLTHVSRILGMETFPDLCTPLYSLIDREISSNSPQSEGNLIERSLAEIEKHKYFLSEKVGHDVGWEVAEQDWESNYAEEFRQNAKSGPQGTKGVSIFLKRLLPRR